MAREPSLRSTNAYCPGGPPFQMEHTPSSFAPALSRWNSPKIRRPSRPGAEQGAVIGGAPTSAHTRVGEQSPYYALPEGPGNKTATRRASEERSAPNVK